MKEETLTSCYLSPVLLPFECIPSVQCSLLLAICSKCVSFLVTTRIDQFHSVLAATGWAEVIHGLCCSLGRSSQVNEH